MRLHPHVTSDDGVLAGHCILGEGADLGQEACGGTDIAKEYLLAVGGVVVLHTFIDLTSSQLNSNS